MVKRVFGFILFLWMAGSLFALLKEIGGHSGTRLYVNMGVGAMLFALAAIGLLLAFGKSKTRPPAGKADAPEILNIEPPPSAGLEQNPYRSPTDPTQRPPKPSMTFGSYVGAAVDIFVWIALLIIGIGLVAVVLALLGVWR